MLLAYLVCFPCVCAWFFTLVLGLLHGLFDVGFKL